MEDNVAWFNFTQSGSVADYLNYINSKENMNFDGATDTVHNRRPDNKGNERRGE